MSQSGVFLLKKINDNLIMYCEIYSQFKFKKNIKCVLHDAHNTAFQLANNLHSKFASLHVKLNIIDSVVFI